MIAYKKVGVCFCFGGVGLRFLVLTGQFVSLLNFVLNQYFAVLYVRNAAKTKGWPGQANLGSTWRKAEQGIPLKISYNYVLYRLLLFLSS